MISGDRAYLTLMNARRIAMTMVRKQIYITGDQDEALKNRAEQLGVTEAEVIRRALDAVRTEL
jgi:hypothetical protein